MDAELAESIGVSTKGRKNRFEPAGHPMKSWKETIVTRRGFLEGLLAGGIWSALKGQVSAAQASSMKEVETLQNNWKALLAEGTSVPRPTERLKLTKEEWRKRLDPNQFDVLREEGTERPGTSPLNNEKRPGIFTCAGCGLRSLRPG